MKNNSITPTFLGDTEHVFVQANHFIQARYKDPLSYWETVIFGKMCTLIGSEDNDFKDYRVHIKDLISMLDVTKTGRVYEDFVEAANRLRTREIIIKFPDEKGKEMTLETALVTGVARLTRTRKPDDMFVDLNIHPKLIPFLIELRKDFTLLDLRDYKHLHSATSIRIYHILKSYMGRGNASPEIDVEKLKGMLGLTNKYPHYANFKARVLEDARRRLLDGAYLAFDYEELKEAGRGSGRVVAVRFQLFANTPKHAQTEMLDQISQQELLFLPEVDKSRLNNASKQKNTEGVVTEVSQDDLTIKILSFGVKPKQLTQLKDEFSEIDMRQAIAVTEGVIASGKLKTSAAGFFVSALKNHYEVAKPLKAVRKEVLKADKNPVMNESTAKALADDLAKADKVAERAAATRQQFEQEKAIVEKLIEEDTNLVNEAIAEIRRGMFGFAYNEDKSFAENRENKVFEAAFMNTIKKLREDLFR